MNVATWADQRPNVVVFAARANSAWRFRSSRVFARSRDDRSLTGRSIDRPTDRYRPDLLGRRGTRKCISGFLCSRARAATSGNNVSPLLLAALFLPTPSSPFFPSSFPLSPRAAPHTDLLPLSRPVRLFFPLPHRPRLIPLSSPSRFRHPRFAAPAACRKPSIYLSCLSFSFFLSFSLVVSLSRSWTDTVPPPLPPVRYIKPLGDIFSRRPWRKKKPNISWRQIVIGACTTGTVRLSADRSLVAEETVQRGWLSRLGKKAGRGRVSRRVPLRVVVVDDFSMNPSTRRESHSEKEKKHSIDLSCFSVAAAAWPGSTTACAGTITSRMWRQCSTSSCRPRPSSTSPWRATRPH